MAPAGAGRQALQHPAKAAGASGRAALSLRGSPPPPADARRRAAAPPPSPRAAQASCSRPGAMSAPKEESPTRPSYRLVDRSGGELDQMDVVPVQEGESCCGWLAGPGGGLPGSHSAHKSCACLRGWQRGSGACRTARVDDAARLASCRLSPAGSGAPAGGRRERRPGRGHCGRGAGIREQCPGVSGRRCKQWLRYSGGAAGQIPPAPEPSMPRRPPCRARRPPHGLAPCSHLPCSATQEPGQDRAAA